MLSTNLVWLRKHYQYTQEEIAQQVGVSNGKAEFPKQKDIKK